MHDDIERILAEDEKITPSPEFLPSVMAAVQREATFLPPLQFPWLRALPGFLVTAVALVVAVWQGIVSLSDPVAAAAFDEQLRQLMALATGAGLQWILLSAAITIAAALLPLGLMRAGNGARPH